MPTRGAHGHWALLRARALLALLLALLPLALLRALLPLALLRALLPLALQQPLLPLLLALLPLGPQLRCAARAPAQMRPPGPPPCPGGSGR